MSKRVDLLQYITGVIDAADSGELVPQIEARLREVIAAVMKTGGKGAVTLKLEFKKVGGASEIGIVPKVSSTVPRPDIQKRICFADDKGDLHLDIPQQGQLPFDEVDAPKRVKAPKYGTNQ